MQRSSIQIIFTEIETEKPHGFLICSKVLIEESLSKLREAALAEISDVLPSSYRFTAGGVPISSKQELSYPTKYFLKKSKHDPMIMGLDAMCIFIISGSGQRDKMIESQEIEKPEIHSSTPVIRTLPNPENDQQEKVRETAGKARKRTQFRIPTPNFESEEKREKPDPFEFFDPEVDCIEEDTTSTIDQDLQSDDSNGANVTVSLSKDESQTSSDATATASLTGSQSEKPFETIEIHDEPDSSLENPAFSVLSSSGRFVEDEPSSSSSPKEKDIQSQCKPSMLQTYFGTKSARDDRYPHARSKNIKLYSDSDISKAKGFNVHRLRFWNEKAEELCKSPLTRNWKKEQIHGAIDADWTLKKTAIMKQEVCALEDKVKHLKDIYEDMDEDILSKTNIAKNEDRVGIAAKVVNDCNDSLVDIRDQMNQCFNTSERQNLRKEKTRLETMQKSNWVDLKKAQDALRKSLDQAKKNVSAAELEQAERRLREEDRTNEYPELDQNEEDQLVTSVKTTFHPAN